MKLQHTAFNKGSPPLARGVQIVFAILIKSFGITPACAGSTVLQLLLQHRDGDHPRLRGEYSAYPFAIATEKGSPPLARGVRIRNRPDVARARITPACAGSTSIQTELNDIKKDHPRLRGEYSYAMRKYLDLQGSPPLARGVLRDEVVNAFEYRITPACAGSTETRMRLLHPTRDHPRLRGEYFSFICQIWDVLGSPPLARGVL